MSESAASRRRVVLVGDPDWDTRAILTRALDHAGYDVHVADDGDTLIGLVERDGADLVIAELYMQCRSGRCTVQSLKRDAALRAIPVLVYTSRVLPTDEAWAREVGAERYLRKPASLEELLAAVEELATRTSSPAAPRVSRGPRDASPPHSNGDSPRA